MHTLIVPQENYLLSKDPWIVLLRINRKIKMLFLGNGIL